MPSIFTLRSAQYRPGEGRQYTVNSTHAPSTLPSKKHALPTPLSPEERAKRRAPPSSRQEPPLAQRLPNRKRTQPNLRLFTRDFKLDLQLAPSIHERAAPGPAADAATTAALGQCVDLALRLLEEGRGNRVLVTVGQKIVAERRRAAAAGAGDGGEGGRPAAGIYKGDIGDMPVWVERFLRQVREVGIPICVCESLSGYGLTQRWGWGTDMEEYDCRDSAIVYINQCLVNNLLESSRLVKQYTTEHSILKAKILAQGTTTDMSDNNHPDTRTRTQQQLQLHHLSQAKSQAQTDLDLAVFSTSVFLAHEFVHCFTGFLTGGSQPATPPGLNASPYSDEARGEAGWYWTRHTFGGMGHVWCCKSAEPPAGADADADGDAGTWRGKFGVPMLLQYNKRRSESFFYQVDHEVVRSIVGADWAAADSLDPDWVLKLRDEATRTPFQEWSHAYEEIVTRKVATGEGILGADLRIPWHVFVKLIGAVLGSCLSCASRLIFRNRNYISSTRSRLPYPSRPSIAAANAISKGKRWGRKGMRVYMK